jgi:restriction system protein
LFDSGSRLYHVGEVKSGVRFDAEYNAVPYTRDVRWIGTVSRDALSVHARNRLGAILTLFAVHSDVQKEIKTILDGTKHVLESPQEEEQEIREIGEEVVGKAREYLKDKILDLSWDDMQEVVAGLLRAMGYKTRVSESGPDRGKDIVASPDGFGLEEPRVHVEVKHRNGQMGAPEVRAFIGGLRKTKGLYISTGGFSREAHYEAERSDVPVTLVDVEELARMIVQYYDGFDSEARTLLPLKKLYWPL